MATVDKTPLDRALLTVPTGSRIPAGMYVLILDDRESLALQGILSAFLHEAAKIPDFYPQDCVELGNDLSDKLIKARMCTFPGLRRD